MSTRLTLKQFKALQNAKGKPKAKRVPKSKKVTVTVQKSSAPVSIGMRLVNKPAKFHQINSKDGSIRVTKEEYSFDVTPNAATFNVTRNIPINPGNEDFSPWLGQIAPGWEMWNAENLSIHYRPLVATTATGAIYVAIDYDSLDSAPADKQSMMAFAGAQRCSVWEPMDVHIDKTYLTKYKNRYVLGDPVPTGADARLYNLGNLIIAVDGASQGVKIGEIYVSYTFTLHVPQKQTAETGSVTMGNTPNVASTPFLNQATKVVTGAVVDAVSSNVLKFTEKGRQILDLQTTFTSAATNTIPTLVSDAFAGVANATITNLMGGQQYLSGQRGSSSFIVDVVKPPASVTVDFSPSGTGPISNTGAMVSKYGVGQVL